LRTCSKLSEGSNGQVEARKGQGGLFKATGERARSANEVNSSDGFVSGNDDKHRWQLHVNG
jgi:hypothetical protein